MRLVCSLLCTKGLTEVVQTSDIKWTLATERLFTAVPWYPLDGRALSGGVLGGPPYRRNSNQRKPPLTRESTLLQIILYSEGLSVQLCCQGHAEEPVSEPGFQLVW